MKTPLNYYIQFSRFSELLTSLRLTSLRSADAMRTRAWNSLMAKPPAVVETPHDQE